MSVETASIITAISGSVVAVVVAGGAIAALVRKPFNNLETSLREDINNLSAVIQKGLDEVRKEIGELGTKVENVNERLLDVEHQQQIVIGTLRAHASSPVRETIRNIIPYQPRVGSE